MSKKNNSYDEEPIEIPLQVRFAASRAIIVAKRAAMITDGTLKGIIYFEKFSAKYSPKLGNNKTINES